MKTGPFSNFFKLLHGQSRAIVSSEIDAIWTFVDHVDVRLYVRTCASVILSINGGFPRSKTSAKAMECSSLAHDEVLNAKFAPILLLRNVPYLKVVNLRQMHVRRSTRTRSYVQHIDNDMDLSKFCSRKPITGVEIDVTNWSYCCFCAQSFGLPNHCGPSQPFSFTHTKIKILQILTGIFILR